jgi:hypothetical protein
MELDSIAKKKFKSFLARYLSGSGFEKSQEANLISILAPTLPLADPYVACHWNSER